MCVQWNLWTLVVSIWERSEVLCVEGQNPCLLFWRVIRRFPPLLRTCIIILSIQEHFLVPDHNIKDISGASFSGFYYICFQSSQGTIDGYYYHKSSEWWESSCTHHTCAYVVVQWASRYSFYIILYTYFQHTKALRVTPFLCCVVLKDYLSTSLLWTHTCRYQSISLQHVPEETVSVFQFH